MKKTLSLVTLLAAGASQAAGFAIDTHSARATGLGLGTAVIDDSAAVYYNPANLLGVKKLDITVGDTPILPDVRFTPEGGTAQGQKPGVSPPFHLFAAYRVHERAVLGLGVYTPFGAGSRWMDDFSARFRAQESLLTTFNINPSVGYLFHDRVRVGAGIQVMRGSVELRRKLDFVTTEGDVHLGGGAWGWGYNLGLQGELVKQHAWLGLTYRSSVDMTFEGAADFDNVPVEFESRLKDQTVTAPVTLPGTISAGLTVKPLARLTLAAEANYVAWSSFQELAINFEDSALTNPLPKQWQDTWNYRVGVEYGVTDVLTARAGFVYDPTPSPATTLTPDLPDANRTKVTLGAGYVLGSLRADVGYQYVFLGDTQSTAPGAAGTYSGNAHVGALTLGYSM